MVQKVGWGCLVKGIGVGSEGRLGLFGQGNQCWFRRLIGVVWSRESLLVQNQKVDCGCLVQGITVGSESEGRLGLFGPGNHSWFRR